MNPRKPHLILPLRQHLIDPEEPGIDFALACADCGCTSCCVDIDTVDDQRRPHRPHRGRGASPAPRTAH